MSSPVCYPLHWPPNFPRTEVGKRESSQMRTGLSAALKNVQDEIRKLGGTGLILSSNCTLGNERPTDPGVAAWFTRDKEQICIPCDRWRDVASNLQAIAKTVEAFRGIERWGAKNMVKAAFRGFAALPYSGTQTDPWAVLGIHEGPASRTRENIEDVYRHKAKICHPDHGGSNEAMAALNTAREQALASL